MTDIKPDVELYFPLLLDSCGFTPTDDLLGFTPAAAAPRRTLTAEHRENIRKSQRQRWGLGDPVENVDQVTVEEVLRSIARRS